MDDGYGGQFKNIYDGATNNALLEHHQKNLQNGLLYRFRAIALNFNGKSEPSEIAEFYVCTSPTSFKAPVVRDQTSSSITIEWLPPLDDGGCSILGYAVFRDDGLGSEIDQEVNQEEDPLVRNLPSLDQMTVTSFPDASSGRTFRL
jgi:hypothetical protein